MALPGSKKHLFESSHRSKEREFICYYNGSKLDKTFMGNPAKRAVMKAASYLFKQNPSLNEIKFEIRYKNNEKEAYPVIATQKKLDPPIKIGDKEMSYSNKNEISDN